MIDAADALAFRSKSDLAYEWLREQILSGALEAGERIGVDALTRRLKVSKIPIREALGRLEAQGLVVQRANVGATVAKLSLHDVRGVFLARQSLEGLVARLAAPLIAKADLGRLERGQDRMRQALATGKLSQMSGLNHEFHLIIARASGYRVLADLNEQLLTTLRRYRSVTPLDPDNWRRIVAEHAEIVDALARGDAEGAGRAAERHAASQAEHEMRSWSVEAAGGAGSPDPGGHGPP